MGKLINRILGSRLLISSLLGSALRTHVELLGKPPMSTSVLKALPGKLDIKRHSPSILYLSVGNITFAGRHTYSVLIALFCLKILRLPFHKVLSSEDFDEIKPT